jgi:hypothetical protein
MMMAPSLANEFDFGSSSLLLLASLTLLLLPPIPVDTSSSPPCALPDGGGCHVIPLPPPAKLPSSSPIPRYPLLIQSIPAAIHPFFAPPRLHPISPAHDEPSQSIAIAMMTGPVKSNYSSVAHNSFSFVAASSLFPHDPLAAFSTYEHPANQQQLLYDF